MLKREENGIAIRLLRPTNLSTMLFINLDSRYEIPREIKIDMNPFSNDSFRYISLISSFVAPKHVKIALVFLSSE